MAADRSATKSTRFSSAIPHPAGVPNQRARLLTLSSVVAAAVALLCYLVVSHAEGEPRYHARPLSYWLPRLHDQFLRASEQNASRTAVAQIGLNNLPLLLGWFREQEPTPVVSAYSRFIDSLLAKQHLITMRRTRMRYQPSHSTMACSVFTEVPSVARAAIPQFVTMLGDPEHTVRERACLVLVAIGVDAIPDLVSVLASTNETSRALAAAALGSIGGDAQSLIPKLEPLLTDTSASTRFSAADAISRLGGDPGTFVPALVQLVGHADIATRHNASALLSFHKNRASSAVPALLAALSACTNAIDGVPIYDALNAIDPSAAQTVETTWQDHSDLPFQ